MSITNPIALRLNNTTLCAIKLLFFGISHNYTNWNQYDVQFVK
jgi:hypothetical protein